MAAPKASLPLPESSLDADQKTFVQHLARPDITASALRDLHRLLTKLPEAPSSQRDSREALGELIGWLLRGWPRKDPAKANARLAALLDALAAVPSWSERLVGLLASVFDRVDAVPLFEEGLPNDRGIWEESKDRLARRFIPEVPDERDLLATFGEWFGSKRSASWFLGLRPELFQRLSNLLPQQAKDNLQQGLLDAIGLIAARTSALGLSREMRARSPSTLLRDSSFFLLPRACDALLEGRGTSAACLQQVNASRIALGSVHTHLERYGVSVDVVYRIDVIDKNLSRLTHLLTILEERGETRSRLAIDLLHQVAHAHVQNRSLRDLVGTNLQLLARKVIERAGHTGEHYITVTERQYFLMLLSASGGGFVTAFTCMAKFMVSWGRFPLFIEGFLASLNYAASFVLIQLLGFTLATKQPSAIAAALAHALHGSSTRPQLDDLVTLIARICRSQFIAVIGNLAMVIPASISLHIVYLRVTGQPFMDEKGAAYVLHSTHPLETGTIGFAALTGVLLWASSLCAGWLENWSAYHRLPEAIAQRKPRWLTGYLGEKFAHHVAGFGGNVSLGFMLGMLPAFGKFLGLPLEVRHVTLATGSLTLALCELGVDALRHGLVPAVVGIACVLALNFSVSFTLALMVALRARGVEHAGLRLVGALFQRFVRSPQEFFLPPPKELEAGPHSTTTTVSAHGAADKAGG